jgi:ELWxxDGT repeat protein
MSCRGKRPSATARSPAREFKKISEVPVDPAMAVLKADPAASSGVGNLVVWGSSLFFSARTPPEGPSLWKTNGTALGTVLVQDPVAGGGSSGSIGRIVRAGSLLFFDAGPGLWRSNGTPAGTFVVGPYGLSEAVAVGSKLFFTFFEDLLVSDGTVAGTFLLESFPPGNGNAAA